MRTFSVEGGGTWVATVEAREGEDYKGRYGLVIVPEGGSSEELLVVEDIRWNSERTARRTLRTMSQGELRRRLECAVGRAG